MHNTIENSEARLHDGKHEQYNNIDDLVGEDYSTPWATRSVSIQEDISTSESVRQVNGKGIVYTVNSCCAFGASEAVTK